MNKDAKTPILAEPANLLGPLPGSVRLIDRGDRMPETDVKQSCTVGRFEWTWQGTPVRVEYEVRGAGPPLLLLPAFSTVSSRDEMADIASALSDRFRTIATDWPGFGAKAGPKLDHSPALHQAFLQAFVRGVFEEAPAVIAAGHAAAYVLHLVQEQPGAFRSIALIAPTWRGPLPTMMQGRRPVQDRILAIIRAPVIGPLLYRLNVSRPVIAMMYRRHVYVDGGRITAAFVSRKADAARRPGGRFGSGAFVTGALDAVPDRTAFLALAQAAAVPVLVVFGPETPTRSLLEIRALAALPGIQSCLLPTGSLGLSEEDPDAVVAAISGFLEATASAPQPALDP